MRVSGVLPLFSLGGHKQAIGTKVRRILTLVYSLRRGERAERIGRRRAYAVGAA